MHTYKSIKRPKGGTAVDGIIPSRRTPPQVGQAAPRPIRRTTAYRPEVAAPPRARETRVGDFRQPASTGSLASQAKPLRVSGGSIAIEEPWERQVKGGKSSRKQKRRLWPFGKRTEKKKSRTKKKKLKRFLLVLLALFIIAGGFLFAKTWWNARKILSGGGGSPALQDCEDLSKLNQEGDCRVNVMLLGKGGGVHEAPDLTDTLIIASIDPINKEAALVSVPRDLYVKPDGEYGYTKINAVYANAKSAARAEGKSNKDSEKAGLAAIEKTLETKLGIPIHYYGMIDFTGFKRAIDTVGGVTIDVKEPLYDRSVAWENNWNPLIAAKGIQKMNGNQALLYARSRQSSARGDFDRAVRQREVIVALKDKIFTAGTYGNPVKVTQLLDTFGNHIETNFSIDEIMKLYGIGRDTQSQNIKSIGLSDPPNDYITTDMYNGQSVVIPKAGIDDYSAIQRFVRRTLIDPRIRQENAEVVVLNGTNSAGLAKTKADILKSYGYRVGDVKDAPTKDYTNSVLIDLRDGDKKYTRHYLERRFKTSATGRLPEGITAPPTADFVIILGQNEAGH